MGIFRPVCYLFIGGLRWMWFLEKLVSKPFDIEQNLRLP